MPHSELARFLTLLRIKDRAEAHNYIRGRGALHRKSYTGRWDATHTFLMGGTIGMGTPHNNERTNPGAGWVVGGWMVGWSNLIL